MSRVGFAGMGNMGSRMAARLLGAGHEVAVWNRTAERTKPLAEKGAKVAATPAEMAAGVDVAFTNLADGKALKEVVLGANGVFSAKPLPKMLVDMGTVGPVESAEVAKEAERLGVGYLRAPVSGSTMLAEAGTLTILASGPEAVYSAADPYLAELGGTRFYVGEGERARFLKLILNVMVATQVQILAESVVLGEKAGMDWAKMLEVIGGSVVGSPLVKYKSGPLAQRNYNAAFRMDLMAKDLDLALSSAKEAGVEMPITRSVREFYGKAIAAGLGDKDFSAVTLELEKMAGI